MKLTVRPLTPNLWSALEDLFGNEKAPASRETPKRLPRVVISQPERALRIGDRDG